MTKDKIIALVDGLTDDELADLEKLVKAARARLRKKESHGWKTEGSDIDANPGTGEIVKR